MKAKSFSLSLAVGFFIVLFALLFHSSCREYLKSDLTNFETENSFKPEFRSQSNASVTQESYERGVANWEAIRSDESQLSSILSNANSFSLENQSIGNGGFLYAQLTIDDNGEFGVFVYDPDHSGQYENYVYVPANQGLQNIEPIELWSELGIQNEISWEETNSRVNDWTQDDVRSDWIEEKVNETLNDPESGIVRYFNLPGGDLITGSDYKLFMGIDGNEVQLVVQNTAVSNENAYMDLTTPCPIVCDTSTNPNPISNGGVGGW